LDADAGESAGEPLWQRSSLRRARNGAVTPWLRNDDAGKMTRVSRIALCIALFLMPCCTQAEVRDHETAFFQGSFGDLRVELAAARKEGKKGVLLVFEMEDCPFCYRFHNTILNQSAVQDYYRSHFLIYRIDIKGDNAIAGFDGRQTIEKEFAGANRVRATPTCIFYALDGKEIVRFSGVAKDAAEFLLLGNFVISDAWLNSSFTKFKSDRSVR